MIKTNLYKRRSIRLQDYDYSQPGEYFITICTYQHEYLFGEIVGDKMRLNMLGKIVQEEWLRTANIRKIVEMDSFVVMPNHVHGIIVLTEPVRANCYSPQNCHTPNLNSQNNPSDKGAYIDTPLRNIKFYSPSGTIGAIIRGFKSVSTKRINTLRNSPRQPIWQRNYYEHIIRDEKDLQNVRDYIVNNPIKWFSDKENPGGDK